MATKRLSTILREFNISLERATEFLVSAGYDIEPRPTTKVTEDIYQVLADEFQSDRSKKIASKEVAEEKKKEKEAMMVEIEKKVPPKKEIIKTRKEVLKGPTSVGKIDLSPKPKKPKEEKKEEPVVEVKKEEPVVEAKKEEPVVEVKKEEPVAEVKKEEISEPKAVIKKKPEPEPEEEKSVSKKHETEYKKLDGPKLTGKTIDLEVFKKPPKSEKKEAEKKEAEKKKSIEANKRKRKRIKQPPLAKSNNKSSFAKKRPNQPNRVEPTEEDVQRQVKETLEKLQKKSDNKSYKFRKGKRDAHKQKAEEKLIQEQEDSKVLKVTEFVTVNELSTMMDVPVTDIISACMTLGMMVAMNQRLDAETLTIIAEEFGYTVEFTTSELEETIVQNDEEDDESLLEPRPPIVTIMGHVDHGKTSLLDYVRKTNVIAGESGGITQHIGAYGVTLANGNKITFLDTPGHEAFTAMRARGAQVTDLAIIIIAADDSVMPQTEEALNHASAARVPIIFAINKIDKPDTNPEKIKERLASLDYLVEDWGGKFQCQGVSAITGEGIDELLEKVLLEAEMLQLKANPNKKAIGTVIEASLDVGRGYVSTLLVEAGQLKIGDYVLAGKNHGKIKAMFDERGQKLEAAGPSTPVSVIGLDGAPTAGDKFNVIEDEKEAKQIASKRQQLFREQAIRTQKHITLDEIGRRIALGNFKELNLIIKGDVDGSIEALSDSLLKLSNEEITMNIIHKGVGPITESDVHLASASDAVVIGFNVRPSGNAKSLADKEEIDIRIYSIIYDVIDDMKDAMEGMLSPEIKSESIGNVEVREIFKISKIGTIAGCMVTSGKIQRDSKIQLVRDGIVVHKGSLSSLKRFKEDAKEVSKGFDCGLQIGGFKEIMVGDQIEAYKETKVRKKL